MFAKIMGVFDLYAIIAILLAPLFPIKLVLYGAGWLILKGGIFAMMGNIISYIDIFFGLYMVFLAFGISSSILTIIAIIYLGQKVLFSVIDFG